MGAWISSGVDRINLGEEKSNFFKNGVSFDELNSSTVFEISENKELEIIQISNYIPNEKLSYVNEIFRTRPDLTFRVWGFFGDRYNLDLSFFKSLPYVKKIWLSCHNKIVNFDVLKELELIELVLELFDQYDYSIISEINPTLEFLYLGDTRHTKNFDCEWLKRFPNLKDLNLWKVKKNLESIAELNNLETLTFRAVSPKSFEFINNTNIKCLNLNLCSVQDLNEISVNETIEHLDFWRLSKLNNLDFISNMENIKTLTFKTVSLPEVFPDISKLKLLESVKLSGMKNLKDITSIYNSNSLKTFEICDIKNFEASDFEPLFRNPNIENISCYGGSNKQKSKQLDELAVKYNKKFNISRF